MVDYKVIEWPFQHVFRTRVTSKNIWEEVKRQATLVKEDVSSELEENDVIVDFCTMHYGMKNLNPLRFVKFYSKQDVQSRCCECIYLLFMIFQVVGVRKRGIILLFNLSVSQKSCFGSIPKSQNIGVVCRLDTDEFWIPFLLKERRRR